MGGIDLTISTSDRSVHDSPSKGSATANAGMANKNKFANSNPRHSRVGAESTDFQGFIPATRMPRLSGFVKSQKFEAFIAVVIFTNCGTMGLQAEAILGNVSGWDDVTDVCEYIFTFIFSSELLLRILFFGVRAYIPPCPTHAPQGLSSHAPHVHFSFLDCFDAALVLISLVSLAGSIMGNPDEGSNVLRTFTVLRALRLLRLVRIVKKIEAFHEVWLLLRGLLDSCRTLIWTVVVISAVTYIFAVFGVVLISPTIKEALADAPLESEEELQALWESCDSIPSIMYTLIQVLTLDSWTSVSRPMKKYIWWSWIYFYFYICVAVFVLMNLVTAIIVENALKHSQNDEQMLLEQKEKKRKDVMEQFTSLFELMDSDGDHQLSKEEFEQAFETDEVSTKLKLLDFGPDDCRDLFYLLDSGDGSLSLQEFFNGLTRMEGAASAKDVFRIMKNTESVERLIKQVHQELIEDIREIMRNVPGCQLRKRDGTLKRRANQSAVCSPDIEWDSATPSTAGRAKVVKQKSNNSVVGGTKMVESPRATPLAANSPEAWRDVLDRLEQLSQRIDSWSQKVDVCWPEYMKRLDVTEQTISAAAKEFTTAQAGILAQHSARQHSGRRELTRSGMSGLCSAAFKADAEKQQR